MYISVVIRYTRHMIVRKYTMSVFFIIRHIIIMTIIIMIIIMTRYMPSMDEQFTVFNIPGVHITHPTTGVCIIIIIIIIMFREEKKKSRT